ncbi:hypothetical protein ABGV42_00680 [Paenibacillus pabuli]|uniref:hypothetical protein n=1 Tax=Paenibacillus pabuli TaxID=1472 RepID=UPI003241C201
MNIGSESSGIAINGHVGTWYVIDRSNYRGVKVFLLESEVYGEDAAHIIVTADGQIVAEDVYNGFLDLEYE